ncbi:MAG: VWA domain-containing protein [Deltaproteobacteria bacterium]|jgi:serine/threonine-protein kinase PpkA|nr:VWA domain-containing protein [Deltaproteobacteria bacterium]
MKFSKFYPVFFSVLLGVALFSGTLFAQAKKPLLMEGKRTLYQKIITHPGAVYRDTPTAEPKGAILPFTVLYVYDRQEANGRFWLQCATGTNGEGLTWIREDRVSEWKQSLVLVFAEKTGRAPLLFFKKKADLLNLAKSTGVAAALDTLTKSFKDYALTAQSPPIDFPVVAMEPENDQGAIPSDRFYLMPIFNYDEELEETMLLDVATIDPGNPDRVVRNLPQGGASGAGNAGNAGQQPPPAPKVGIAFVIDTTISMGPYIEICRQLARDIYQKLIDGGNAENIYLAFVAFRSSVKASPDIEYTTKIISDFKNANDRASFESALGEVKEAASSTHSFNEDSMAGLAAAVEQLDWTPFDGGIILLLTDAGPLNSSDEYRTVPDNPNSIKAKAAAKKIRIVPIHLKTPQGTNNHRQAQQAYEAMAYDVAGARTYVDIKIQDPTLGPEVYRSATQGLVNNLETSLRAMNVPVTAADINDAPAASADPVQKASDIGTLLGYSIRLDYLGNKNETTPPRVIRSWITDKDLANLIAERSRDVRTVQVAVLLTRNQLGALSASLRSIIQGAENARLSNDSSLDFFDYVISAAAEIARDPGEFSLNPGAKKLGESGVLSEFLDGLPYKSKVMNLTERDWDTMDAVAQSEFIEDLKSKVDLYEKYNADVNNWGKFNEANSSEWLYRVPLTDLP